MGALLKRKLIYSNLASFGFISSLFLLSFIFILLVSCESGKDDGGDGSPVLDDSNGDDDTGPGTEGWVVNNNLDLYKFDKHRIEAARIKDFGSDGDSLIVANDGVVYFAITESENRFIWKYDGYEFTEVFSDNSSGEECTQHFTSLAFFGPNDEDFLILTYCNYGDDGDTLRYQPLNPGVAPYGMFSGFRGGAFPYDEMTVYEYDGESLTPLATVPHGHLLLVKPFGIDGIAAVTDENALWIWSPEAGWVELCEDVPWGEADMILTDREGDILFGKYLGDFPYQWRYYEILDGELVPYTTFDTDSCSNFTVALLKGNGKAFWCDKAPTDLNCDEADGTASYFVRETDGDITCQGTAIGYQPWMSTLWVQW